MLIVFCFIVKNECFNNFYNAMIYISLYYDLFYVKIIFIELDLHLEKVKLNFLIIYMNN